MCSCVCVCVCLTVCLCVTISVVVSAGRAREKSAHCRIVKNSGNAAVEGNITLTQQVLYT